LFSDTAVSFIRAIDLILISKRYDQLSNMFGTNSYIVYSSGYVGVYSSSYNDGACVCSSQFSCTEQIMLQQNTTRIPVQGWYIGCYMIDSLLDSTLECYYNETCIDLIYDLMPSVNFYGVVWNSSIPRPQSLNSSLAEMSLFPVNLTIRDCLQELLVNKWNPMTNFSKYYQECQPTECSYTASIRKDLLVVVTTLVGLLGGLSAALHLLAPIAVRILYDFVPAAWEFGKDKIGLNEQHSTNRVSSAPD